MRSVICVHERFDAHWPFSADYWHECWGQNGGCELYRSEDPDARAPQLVPDPASVQRLVLLGFPADPEDLEPFSGLEECFHNMNGYQSTEGVEGVEAAVARGVSFIAHRADLYWGQSVSEFALALTLCALRRIPQTYAAMMQSHEPGTICPTWANLGSVVGSLGTIPDLPTAHWLVSA